MTKNNMSFQKIRCSFQTGWTGCTNNISNNHKYMIVMMVWRSSIMVKEKYKGELLEQRNFNFVACVKSIHLSI